MAPPADNCGDVLITVLVLVSTIATVGSKTLRIYTRDPLAARKSGPDPKAIGVMVAVSPSSGGAVGVLGAIGTVTLASLYALRVSLTRTVNWSTVFAPAAWRAAGVGV